MLTSLRARARRGRRRTTSTVNLHGRARPSARKKRCRRRLPPHSSIPCTWSKRTSRQSYCDQRRCSAWCVAAAIAGLLRRLGLGFGGEKGREGAEQQRSRSRVRGGVFIHGKDRGMVAMWRYASWGSPTPLPWPYQATGGRMTLHFCKNPPSHFSVFCNFMFPPPNQLKK